MDVHPRPSSLELLTRARHGDRRALTRLVDRLRPRLLRIIRGIGGHRFWARFDPEDVLHEALCQALRAPDSMRSSSLIGFLSWFAGIARNRIRKHVHRGRDRQRTTSRTPLPAMQLAFLPAPILEPTTGVVWRPSDDPEDVDSDLDQLGAAQRLTLVGRDVFDARWDTVAFVVDRAAGAARTVHHRARGRILVPEPATQTSSRT